MYDDFIRWLSRASLLQKFLLLTFFTQKASLSPEEFSALRTKLTQAGVSWNPPRNLRAFRFATQEWLPDYREPSVSGEMERKLWLTGNSMPIANERAIQQAINLDGFFRGVKTFTEGIWPTTFFGLLAHDICCYFAAPQNRYGTEFWQILTGLATNQQTLTSSLPTTYAYPATLIGLPLILGLHQRIRRRKWQSRDDSVRVLQDRDSGVFKLFAALDQAEVIALWNRFTEEVQLAEEERPLQRQRQEKSHKPGYGLLRITMPDFAGNIQAEPGAGGPLILPLAEEARAAVCESHLKAISEFVDRHHKFFQLYGLAKLANIADGIKDKDLACLRNMGVDASELAGLRSRRIQALTKLEQHAAYSSLPKFVYANYLLWSIGHSKRRYLEPLYWSYMSLLVYTKLRFWLALGQSAYSGLDWLKNWYECAQQNRTWTYMPQPAEYHCTICGDYPQVYYPDVFLAQTCFDDLTRSAADTESIISMLDRIRSFGIKSADFSKQDWRSWPTTVLQEVLTRINLASGGKLKQLNLSYETSSSHSLNSQQAEILASFLASVEVTDLNLANCGIDANATAILLPRLNGTALQLLNLTGNYLEIRGAEVLAETLSAFPMLTALDLSHNNFTDPQLAELMPALGNTTVINLFLRDNLLTNRGLQIIAANSTLFLEQLDLSGNNFAGADLTALGNFLVESQLHTLALNRVAIDDQAFAGLVPFFANATSLVRVEVADNWLSESSARSLSSVFANATFSELVLAGNSLSDEGMMFIAEALADSAITQLDVSNTGIGDRGVITLSFNLPHTKIISLNLANNYISPVSMPYIAESLGNSSVADIDFSGNRIGDVGISSLSSVTFVDPLCPVTRINLGFNQISAEGATAMADAFATGNVTLTSAVLAGNPITDAGLSELAATLAQTHLLKLDLSGCGITAEGALAFADALPTSSIQSVKLDSNQIADAGALELAQKLIAPVSHQSDLGKQKLSQDLSQAIFAAGPDSQLLNLSLVDNGIGNSGAQALCHVFSAANITSFELAANQIDPSQVDILSCNIMPDISPGSRLEPPLTFVFNGIMEQMPKVDPIAARTFYRKNYGEDFSSLLRLFADTLGTTEVKIQLLYCLAGFLLAFRHEAAGLISRCLSKTMQTRLAGYLNTHEGQLLSIMTEMAARAEFGGVPALVHDVTVIAKSPLEQATNGLLTLAGAYGIAFAVGALTGNPLIGYLSLPIFLNGKKIVTNMQESYQKHGFFAAAERGLETFAYSVPGGQLIEQRQTDCLGGNHV